MSASNSQRIADLTTDVAQAEHHGRLLASRAYIAEHLAQTHANAIQVASVSLSMHF